MATTQASSDVPRPTFAKIAASASKDAMSTSAARRPAPQGKAQPSTNPAPIVVGTPVIANGGVGKLPPKPISTEATPSPAASTSPQPGSTASPGDVVEQIAVGTRNLSLGPKAAPSLVVNGSGIALPDKKHANKDIGSDDSQKADSTSDLGTKPPSLDGKSITSGTTFALDEKESLRPDDSASVKAAAAEDDDAFSIQNSMIAGSRMGSDIAPRFRGGVQTGDIIDRRPVPPMAGPQGMATVQGVASGQQPIVNVVTPPDPLNTIYRHAPDEKLLEAMQSPKDRIFLLRLEKQVVDFVQQSKEPFMDLPPCNSFCRMLTHKLADYYHMTHSYEPAIGSVRIFRTPFCRVPPSLSSIESASAGNTPPPAVLPRKIMRRGEDGDVAASSTGPSKPTSEAGSDGKEKAVPAKEKMTREEREEAYNRARERIFGSQDKNGESSQDADENGVSRASSVSTKDKVNGKRGKVERRRRDSGSFETRNQYAPYYPHPQQPGWQMGGPPPQPQYVPIGSQMPQFNGQQFAGQQFGGQQFSGQQQQPTYSNQGGPMYPPNQNFGHLMPGNFPQYNSGSPAQYTQPGPQRFPMPNNSMTGFGMPVPSPAQAQQPPWQPPVFNTPPSPYQPRGMPPPGHSPVPGPAPCPVPSSAVPNTGQGPTPGPGSAPAPNAGPGAVPTPGTAGIPYAYGQLPANANPNDPKSQHPIPGSYNRHAFNPNTKSFVPNTAGSMPTMPGQTPPYSAGGSHHGSPQVGSPHLAYTGGYQPGMAPPPMPQPYGGAAGYGMVRQGSNNSLGPYHHVPQHLQTGPPPPMPAQAPVQHQPHQPHQQHQPAQAPQHLPPHPPQIPSKPPVPQGPGQQYSHLPPHYGNPASLPPKPT